MTATAKQIREHIAASLDRAVATRRAQADEKGENAEETIRADQTCRVLDDVLRFIDKGR